ncbi:MAG: large subunit ribosomal protein [Patescibacteria group bacterium]|nr:large subunit ribosomal protein [Patescibacteria group bacterium]
MATRKAAGTAKNLTDSNPQYLGIKKHDGEVVSAGNILLKQRGSKYEAGKNTYFGKDYTIHAKTEGKVKFTEKRHMNFDNTWKKKKVVNVITG